MKFTLKDLPLLRISGFLKLIAFMVPMPLAAYQVSGVKTDTLFQSDEIINIELRTDYTAIQKDRIDNPQYHNGELIYFSANGKEMKFTVKVMARGDFRRDPANCNFPPLEVNFKKGEVKNTLFDNQDKLKLVTPCDFDRYVIEEFLIYKLYNLITDRSFKVRLVKMLYYDTGRNKKLFEKYSFFIEHVDQVAERNNSEEITRVVNPYEIDFDTFRKTAFFQYMIGNKDWFVTSRRNIVLMQPKDTTLRVYAIPFDFDFAAFVDADYTKPKDVPPEYLATRRVYKGLCYSIAEYNEVFAYFKSMRPNFESLINNTSLLPKANRMLNLAYLNSFYKIIESSQMIRVEFIDKCESRQKYNIPDIQK